MGTSFSATCRTESSKPGFININRKNIEINRLLDQQEAATKKEVTPKEGTPEVNMIALQITTILYDHYTALDAKKFDQTISPDNKCSLRAVEPYLDLKNDQDKQLVVKFVEELENDLESPERKYPKITQEDIEDIKNGNQCQFEVLLSFAKFRGISDVYLKKNQDSYKRYETGYENQGEKDPQAIYVEYTGNGRSGHFKSMS